MPLADQSGQPSSPARAAGGPLSRRRALKLAGWGVAGAVVAGSGLVVGASTLARAGGDVSGAAEKTVSTVGQWVAIRGERYFIAHRGSGDVIPEHSMEAYRAAVGWGAQCMEISVGMTSDGLLICMHDLDYDRTTSGSGPVNGQPASVLESIRILQPRLGQAWVDNPPRVPRFEEVLAEFGGRLVLAVEAKLNAAYEPMMAMVENYGLRDSVIVKAHYQSKRWAQAKAAGYPVFCYFGNVTEAVPADMTAIAAQLDPKVDVLVIPAFDGAGGYLPDEVVAAAVRTGIPVWAFPLHRRADAEHVFAAGVVGGISSSYGYITGSAATVTADDWAAQAIDAGEMTRDPAIDSLAPEFTRQGEMLLAASDGQHFVALGQLGPLTAGKYTVTLDAGWQTTPASADGSVTVAFGRADDSYYENGLGSGDGYHLVLTADGSIGLYQHVHGSTAATLLAPQIHTPALNAGDWARLQIEVVGTEIAVSRVDSGMTIRANAPTAASGYLHLGRGSADGVAMMRSLQVQFS